MRQALYVVMKNKKPLKDRLALVTGASRGIGRAVALALAQHGAHVVIAARTIGALEELDDEIREAGGKATLLQLDSPRATRSISSGRRCSSAGASSTSSSATPASSARCRRCTT